MARPVRRANAISIFTETFRAWTKDVPAYLGLYFVYALAGVGVVLVATWAFLGVALPATNLLTPSPSSVFPTLPAGYLYVALLANLLDALLGVIFTATITYYALCKRRGVRVPWSDALRVGARRWGSVLGGGLLLGILGFTFTALDLVPFVGASEGRISSAAVTAECGLLVLVLPVLYLTIALGLYAPAVMMEGVGAFASLRRSWSVTRGYRLSIFGAYVLVGLLGGSIILAASFSTNASGDPVLSTAGQLAATAITGSWSILVTAVAYELIGEDRREQALQRAAVA